MCDEKEKLYKNFFLALDSFIENWRIHEEDLDRGTIIISLLAKVKVEACLSYDCYTCMLGFLTYILNDDLENLFKEIGKKGIDYAPCPM